MQKTTMPRGPWLGLAILAATAVLDVPATAAEVDAVHGTTKGLVTDQPNWSAGIQLGTHFDAGLTAQHVGFYDGALNLTVGIPGAFAVSADYLFLYTDDFDPKPLPDGTSYNALRGQLLPYWGLGASVGAGAALRLPFGVQYAMLRDPFDFFGGITLVVGNLGDDDDRVRGRISLNLGARALL